MIKSDQDQPQQPNTQYQVAKEFQRKNAKIPSEQNKLLQI
jgi:hypothetical protein